MAEVARECDYTRVLRRSGTPKAARSLLACWFDGGSENMRSLVVRRGCRQCKERKKVERRKRQVRSWPRQRRGLAVGVGGTSS
ncbi:hypothetical protein KY290_008195 [Solanum tuberosum]|uniref:Uncharacterized protein n=1 Tax=Solanum tuberosum TaxID=4113 RepID=A0ABQ7W7V9_SOLTU|nr:hypothetical protein KY290_008195 [Solanum tuberosum]